MSKLLYEEESYKLRGSCFRVYNALGGGIKEKIIERALIKELALQNINVCKQGRIGIFYNGATFIDKVSQAQKIICELKSKPFIAKEDEKQFWGYLKGSKYQLGFLINFGPQKLTIKRFIHDRKTSV